MSNPNPDPPRAIASLAKKQSDVTRQGTQKLKFVPTLPARRKKEEVKQEPALQLTPGSSNNAQPSSSRGRGDPRGRGRGRPPLPNAEMTASGPFAMGPALAGSASRRTGPRPNQAPAIPTAPTLSAPLGAPPGAKFDRLSQDKVEYDSSQSLALLDPEVYSDQEDGVEIIDLSNVRQLDWMAPEGLKKDNPKGKGIKKEEPITETLKTSTSDSEEEHEAIIEDFSANGAFSVDSPHGERLYFFQFPEPFPEVLSSVPNSRVLSKKVAFSPIPVAPTTLEANTLIQGPIDGVLGQLEVYRSGAVKMRLANGILLDVHPATQSAFLQHVVHNDPSGKQIKVLGEVHKRFIVSPNVDALLLAKDQSNPTTSIPGEENLIKMDES